MSKLYRLLSAGGLVMNPYYQLDKQIGAAASGISEHFDIIDSGLDRGLSVKKASRGHRIEVITRGLISSARLSGFQHGAKHTKKKMPALYGRQLQEVSAERAHEVNRLMRRTTRKRLRSTPDSDYILSRDRAISAARYEAANAYFAGVKDAFSGTGWQKEWITSSAEPCENCQSNEEEGPIDVDATFDSGDDYPAIHLGCSCAVIMVRA